MSGRPHNWEYHSQIIPCTVSMGQSGVGSAKQVLASVALRRVSKILTQQIYGTTLTHSTDSSLLRHERTNRDLFPIDSVRARAAK